MQISESLIDLARKVKGLPPEEHQKRIEALVKSYARRSKERGMRSASSD